MTDANRPTRPDEPIEAELVTEPAAARGDWHRSSPPDRGRARVVAGTVGQC